MRFILTGLFLMAAMPGNAMARGLEPFSNCGRITSPVSKLVAAITAFETDEEKTANRRLRKSAGLTAEISICTEVNRCEVAFIVPGEELLSIQWISPFELAVQTRTLRKSGLQSVLRYSIRDKTMNYFTSFQLSKISSDKYLEKYITELIYFDKDKCKSYFHPIKFIDK